MRRALYVLATAALIAGCGSTTTTVKTVTLTAAGPATPAPTHARPRYYLAGFPRVVPLSAVPERMRLELGEGEGAKSAVAIAPGVWTVNSPGTSALEDAENGSHVGWCSSVRAFEKKSGREAGGSCW
jgi:hypothetical protein